MSLASPVPDAGTPIFDDRGYINAVWHQFFFTLLRRTGGTEGIDSTAENAALNSSVSLPAATSSDSEGLGPVQYQVFSEEVPGPVFQHGQQTDPALHDLVTTTANGFMSAADKVKLDGVLLPSVVPSSLLADVVTSATTADSVILTLWMPAATMAAGTAMAFKLYALVSCAASGGSLNIWIKIGPNKFLTLTFVMPATAQTDVGVWLNATLTVRSPGALGYAELSGTVNSGNNTFNTGPIIKTASIPLNTTTAVDFNIGWNWSAATSGNVATAKNAVINLEKQ